MGWNLRCGLLGATWGYLALLCRAPRLVRCCGCLVGDAVGTDQQRISIEMVYGGLYHYVPLCTTMYYVQALHNGVINRQVSAPEYLAQRAHRLGIVKRLRAGPTHHTRTRISALDNLDNFQFTLAYD